MLDKITPLRHIWLAAVLLTRLPLPHLPASAFQEGPRAVWAYPLIGAGVGIAGALTGWLALTSGLPVLAAAALALGLMMALTGAMHEDGLADVFDGFWGGITAERRLEIMRDSQIGTYGVLALVIIYTLKISAFAVLLQASGGALIAAAALSRGFMPVLMYGLPHARSDGLSHSVGAPTARAAALSLAIGVATALLCLGLSALLAALVAAGICALVAVIAKRKIGGQTGDVLGATQQLCETAILLTCAAQL